MNRSIHSFRFAIHCKSNSDILKMWHHNCFIMYSSRSFLNKGIKTLLSWVNHCACTIRSWARISSISHRFSKRRFPTSNARKLNSQISESLLNRRIIVISISFFSLVSYISSFSLFFWPLSSAPLKLAMICQRLQSVFSSERIMPSEPSISKLLSVNSLNFDTLWSRWGTETLLNLSCLFTKFFCNPIKNFSIQSF